jgi:creatinine amidohydrolase
MISLLDLPQAELARILGRGAPVYLPVNPVEYHGPHLPLHTDLLISMGLIRDMHERLKEKHRDWPLLVATGMEMGVDPVPGPGSRHVSYSVVRDTVTDACRALADLGAKRIILMTFHGSPLHNIALDHAVSAMRKRGVQALAPLNLLLGEMIALDDPQKYRDGFAEIPDEAERREMLDKVAFDFHAGFLETSMLLHYEPNSVLPEYRHLPPCPEVRPSRFILALSRFVRAIGFEQLARDLAFAAVGVGWYAVRPFPGYTGRPHRASSSAGGYFANLIAERFATVAEGVFAGAEPPRAILPWVKLASLGGRVGRLSTDSPGAPHTFEPPALRPSSISSG